MRPRPQGGVAGGRGSDAGLTIVAAGAVGQARAAEPSSPQPAPGGQLPRPQSSHECFSGVPSLYSSRWTWGSTQAGCRAPCGVCVVGDTDGSTRPSSE